MMASLKQHEDHAPLTNLSRTTGTNGDNATNVSGFMTSSDQPLLTDPKERKRQRERNRYAQMSHQRKDELLKKRREAHQQKKVIANLIDVKHYGQMGLEQYVQEKLQCTSEQIVARHANARARYANLKPEQRQAIRDRQRLLYAKMTSEKKEAKRNREKAWCEMRHNTPSKNSIAMKNPLYNSSDSD
ncbi:unnamed protein product [Urochloa decumbens]|uniref:BZIP domain-containing protein n=1 Tax=Urochloa decumbens TaxID=240449 RepID=A0ABC9B1E9_9POAL